MFQVLIVDDENFIRERLKSMIPWNEYGLEVAGLAEDGESALQFMERRKPDIVISDVRMPDMDGLEMIGRALERQWSAKFIILSAYGEFEFAKKALQLGVTDYLLKPTQPEELLAAVMKLVDQLEQERQHKRRDMRMQRYLESVRSQYVHELLLGSHPGYGWEEECANVGLEWLLKGNLRLVLISMESSDLQQEPEAVKTAQFAVQNVMYEIVADGSMRCPVRLSAGRWLVAIAESPSEEGLLEFAHNLSGCIARYTKIKVHIMISEAGDDVMELGRLYWETEKTMDYIGHDPAQPVRFVRPYRKELAYGQWNKPMRELTDWIAGGQSEHIVAWLNELGASFLSWDLEAAQRWCFEWLVSLREHLQPESGDVQDDRTAQELRMQIASQYKHKELLQFFGREVHQLVKQQRGNGPHQLIRKAMQIIEKNYGQEIQLATIAMELGISAVYLSEFFKKETGITFRSYLLQIRMSESIRLLKEPTFKVYEVAYRVGYDKVEHFVKLFKKQYGMTPSEYRGALV